MGGSTSKDKKAILIEQYNYLQARTRADDSKRWTTPAILVGTQALLLPIQLSKKMPANNKLLVGAISSGAGLLGLHLVARQRADDKMQQAWTQQTESTLAIKKPQTETKVKGNDLELKTSPEVNVQTEGLKNWKAGLPLGVDKKLDKLDTTDVWLDGLAVTTCTSSLLVLSAIVTTLSLFSRRWDPAHAATRSWLNSNNIPKFVANRFRQQGITTSNMENLTHITLRDELNINEWGLRNEILQAIRKYSPVPKQDSPLIV